MMSFEEQALQAVRDLAFALNALERKYYLLFTSSTGEADRIAELKNGYIDTKKKVLEVWCSKPIAMNSNSSRLSDPPRFCPADDRIKLVGPTTSPRTVVEYVQSSGLESTMRFVVSKRDDGVAISKIDILDEIGDRWKPLSL